MQNQLVMRRINEMRQLEDAQGEVDAALAGAHRAPCGVEGVIPELRWGVRRWIEEETRSTHFLLQILRRVEVEVLGCGGVELPRERRLRRVSRECLLGRASSGIGWPALR